MTEKKEYKVGVYLRLSKEDTRAGESLSIENQKLMLVNHVKEMGWELIEIYKDDGFSGVNQNRPAFQKMIAHVESGRINTILIKDLSRLGRNYLEVGNLAEVFLPEHGCELISLGEKLDDMMVFRNWFNEQHSKSTSIKVKASRRICAQNGKFLGAYAPYGFKKDPNNRHKLIIDENTAPIARSIFEMRAGGAGFRAIAEKLNNDGIISPREYYYQNIGKKNPCKTTRQWSENTIKDILKNEVYIGNLVQNKAGKLSYKNHKQISKPQEEWIRTNSTHVPIVETKLWEKVQELSGKKYKPRRNLYGEQNLFSGLVYCADCGFRHRIQIQRRIRKSGNAYKYISYICGTYAHSGKNACPIHSISEKALIELAVNPIRNHALKIRYDEKRITEAILSARKNSPLKSSYEKELDTCEKQIEKLDLLIESLYADKISGLIPESLFKRQITKYEQDREKHLKSIKSLNRRITSINKNSDDKLPKLTKTLAEFGAIDSEVLILLIDKIIIGETQIIDGVQICDVKVVYNYEGDAM